MIHNNLAATYVTQGVSNQCHTKNIAIARYLHILRYGNKEIFRHY